MKSRILLSLTVIGLLTQLAIPVRLAAQSTEGDAHHRARFITFDAPGAGTGQYQGTFGVGINSRGEIMGQYYDTRFKDHGFLRSHDGRFTTFNAPGAGDYGTYPWGLNGQGATAGLYFDQRVVEHGFLRRPDGTFATFTDPDACTTSYLKGCYGTILLNINDFGTMAGQYVDANYVEHGLVVGPDGTYTGFEAPGAGEKKGSYQGTFTAIFSGLNNRGRSPDPTLTPTMWNTATCAMAMAALLRSMRRVQVQGPAKVQMSRASTIPS